MWLFGVDKVVRRCTMWLFGVDKVVRRCTMWLFGVDKVLKRCTMWLFGVDNVMKRCTGGRFAPGSWRTLNIGLKEFAQVGGRCRETRRLLKVFEKHDFNQNGRAP